MNAEAIRKFVADNIRGEVDGSLDEENTKIVLLGEIAAHISTIAETDSRIMGVVLELLQSDPHQWSARPCPTCKMITVLSGKDFGCNFYAKQHQVSG